MFDYNNNNNPNNPNNNSQGQNPENRTPTAPPVPPAPPAHSVPPLYSYPTTPGYTYLKAERTPPLSGAALPTSTSPSPSSSPRSEKPKKGKLVGFAAVVVSLAFCFSFLGSALGNQLTSNDNVLTDGGIGSSQASSTDNANSSATAEDTAVLKTAASNGTVMTTEQIAAVASPSVVEITTESVTTGNRMQQLVSTGAGSGVIISADGYIVTNHHVIEGSSKITVTLKDSEQYAATLIGTDKKTDLAVLKIDATDLTAATIGTSADIKVGQDAIIIGNPLGQLGGTVTNGIISALDRSITFEDGTVMRLLQTNAAVNPGNSGGGLFNNEGELVGVVNAKSSGTGIEGIGFAIPIDTAKPIIEDLITYGYVKGRVELGVTLLDVGDQLTAMMYRVNNTGVYVYAVEAGSNAEKAGITSGDRITAVNGTEISTSAEVSTALDSQAVGDTITLTIARQDQTGDISFVLQEQKKELSA